MKRLVTVFLVCTIASFALASELPRISEKYTVQVTDIIDEKLAQNLIGTLLKLDQELSNDTTTQVKAILVIINSPGGEISSTLAIANTMRNLRHPVVTFAPGGAYSGAALILSAGTKGFRYVSDTTIAMIHGVQLGGFFYGGQKEYEETLEIIKKYNQAIINFLHKTTGQTKEKLSKDLMGEKWLVGQEIISYGLADKVIP